MSGIYIHIPFCHQKCHYCNFFSVASSKHMPAFVEALLKEIEQRKGYLDSPKIQTVYFGGGTPSMLQHDFLLRIFEKLYQHFEIHSEAEITLEANPDDISPTYLSLLKTTPVNRLSMGVQSFFDDDLHYLNRNHNGKQARDAVALVQDAGYERLTIDLIYGIPGLTEEKWNENIRVFLQTGIRHLSAYALTVEPKTALAQRIAKGLQRPVNEVESIRHFELLLAALEQEGFVHYEISNFALPGYYSQHNSLYWLGGHYLGLGPSAHSYNGISRQWNVSSLGPYLQQAGSERCVEEKEILTIVQRFNEYVMTSLRTSWGCDSEHILNGFGARYKHYLAEATAPFVLAGKVRYDGQRYFLTNLGKLFADGIASELFLEDELP